MASSLSHSVSQNPKFLQLVMRADLVTGQHGFGSLVCTYRWLDTDFLASSSFSSLCPGLSRIKLAINSADLSQQEEQRPFPALRVGEESGTEGQAPCLPAWEDREIRPVS